MLSAHTITPAQGQSYYTKENYYSLDEGIDNSLWTGRGAKNLGLRGSVKSSDFQNLLDGKLRDGTRFRSQRKLRPGYKERGGLDCTFSAPKSVSILALVENQKELEQAHQKAVLQTLKILERDYASTRVTKNERVVPVNTQNLVIAQFHHDTSRELDPHLHTHCVILNMTKYRARWYSFRNDDVYKNKKLLGTIYQNQLAHQVKQLGYEIEPKEHSQFEIKGFERSQIMSLSQRRQQIISQAPETSTWKQLQTVWSQTRKPKGKEVSRDYLRSRWQQKLVEDIPQPIFNSKSETTTTLDKAVSSAIESLTQSKEVFSSSTLTQEVLQPIGTYSFFRVEKAIALNDNLVYQDRGLTTRLSLDNNSQKLNSNTIHNDESESQPNFQPDIQRVSQSPRRKTRKVRIISPDFTRRVGRLSQAINNFVEREAVWQLTGDFERFNLNLENSRFATGAAATIANSIERLNFSITEYARNRAEKTRSARTIQDSIERLDLSIIEYTRTRQNLTSTREEFERQKLLFRQEYESLRSSVKNWQQKTPQQVDLAVSLLKLKQLSDGNSQDRLLDRVGKVLSQSDTVRHLSQQQNNKEAATQYIIDTFNTASQIRQNILRERKMTEKSNSTQQLEL